MKDNGERCVEIADMRQAVVVVLRESGKVDATSLLGFGSREFKPTGVWKAKVKSEVQRHIAIENAAFN